jgi:hypothetical protein
LRATKNTAIIKKSRHQILIVFVARSSSRLSRYNGELMAKRSDLEP